MKSFTILCFLLFSLTGFAQLNLPVTFEDETLDYGLTDFGGNLSTIIVDPNNATNNIAQTVKTLSAELWAGTTVGGTVGFTNPVPFAVGSTSMSVKVWSPTAGTPIRLKVEASNNPTISVETETNTTVANAWETLVFDFSNEAPGTAPLNLANSYNKASIFFNFGTTGAQAGEQTYYWDDMEFVEGTPVPAVDLPVTFEDETLDYGLTDFGGNLSTIIVDPNNATNNIAQTVKTLSAELWAGTTVGGTVGFTNPVPFAVGSTSMSVKVWSPTAGTPIRLKVEASNNPTISVETETNTTVANAWETLVFDFSNEAPGTAPLNLANSYNKASIFFNFGTTGAQAGEQTYYWDDMEFVKGTPVPAVDLPVTFEDETLDYGLTDFGGNLSTIIVDPNNATNNIAQTVKTLSAELWAGTTVGGAAGFATAIPFTAGSTSMSVKVWSPTAGTPIRLKVEASNNPTISVETEANTTMANAWETLVFDFSNEAPGTAPLNLANSYNKASIFFNFGTTGAQADEQTYYWDDMEFVEGTPVPSVNLPVTFEDETLDYGLTDFGGNLSTIIVDPNNATNNIAQTVKTLSAELWAGTTVGGAAGFATAIPFTAGSTSMSVKIWSPTAGTPIRLKVEASNNPTISVETEANTTLANVWETLVFDFSNEAPGTAPLNLANSYNKASIFFNFGTTGAQAGEQTYYWDDMEFVEGTPVPAVDLPVTFEDETLDYGLTDFGGNLSTIIVDPNNATNNIAQTVKTLSAELWAGTTVGGAAGFATAIPFTAGSTSMSVKVWSPTAGTPIRLKVEASNNPTISVETETNTTVANAWETLVFDFSNEAPGTAPLNLANSYNKASIFFNFGTTGAQAGEKTYFWDDMEFVEGTPVPSVNLPVTFEDETLDYGLTDFGGNLSTIIVDPNNATNNIAQTVKTLSAELWAGTTVGGTVGFTNPVPFAVGSTSMSVKVWSPTAGTPIRLKVEASNNPTISVETETNTTVANAWETLVFDFSNEAPGTAPLNLANSYNKASIFFNFGTTGAQAGEQTYYWDDMEFVEGTPVPAVDLPVTFEDETLDYGLTDFGGNLSTIIVDPNNATNNIAQTVKTLSAELWAGTTVGGAAGFATAIPFTAGSTSMSVKVWSPTAGTPIRLKVEASNNPTISVETEANTTLANAWETLVFDFSNEAPGTAPLNLANSYNKASIFFNFGTTGAQAGEKTYFWDDMEFVEGTPVPSVDLPVTFEDETLDYGLTDFGGNLSTIIVDPNNATNNIAQTVKTLSAELWAGTTVGGAAGFATAIPFTAGSTSMSVKVWSPTAGTPIRLKVEASNNPTISVETEANTTLANAWETLVFDFSNEAPGTAPLNLANSYNKASIFFNFGTTGAQAGEQTYYWDDMEFVEGTPVPAVDLPVTFEDETLDYGLTDFGGNLSTIIVDPNNATNNIAQTVKTVSAELWAGTTVGGTVGFANPVPFAVGSTSMSVKVWSPTAGTPIRLKVEASNNPTISVETETITTVANAWETLIFDFSNEAPGTAPINLANSYNKASIFFNFGTTGAQAGEQTYYWDDMEFVEGTPVPAVDLPVTFEDETLDYGLTDFGGNLSTIIVDPNDATNNIAQTIKTISAELWAGTTVGGTIGFANPVPFAVGSTSMSVKVWSPTAGTPIRLKVEAANDPTISVETETNTTVASAWDTLVFDFSNEAPGTAPLNLANSYNKASIFFNFGTTGAQAGEQTYYWDDMEFVEGTPVPAVDLPVTFEDETLDYGLTDFGGNLSTIIVDPNDATNNIAQTIKTISAELWAGTTVGGTIGFANPVPFAVGSTSMSVKVWSPTAGTPIRLKVEAANDPTISVETETNTTVASAWDTLVFDFSNEAPGTAPLNLANSYNKASIFFNFGTTGAQAGEQTYYWDDMEFVGDTIGEKPLAALDVQDNFENDGFSTIPEWRFQDPDLADLPIIEDPLNPDNHVADYLRSGSFEWTNAQFILDHRMDLTIRNIFDIRVFFPSTNDYTGSLTPTAALKLQNSLLGGEAWQTQTEVKLTVEEFDTWVTLQFDFSAVSDRQDYDQVVVQFGGEGHFVPGQFHFDDLILLEPVSIITLENYKPDLYPNPVVDQFVIGGLESISSVKIYNLQGQLVLYKSGNTPIVDVSALGRGFYQVIVEISGGAMYTAKMLKQ
ncbi:MAG: T9SS type A sorting domain-containing protein [Lentimicrobium sp.]